MLASLWLRLLAGFGVVIVFTLIFASAGSVLLLRDQQAEFAEQRIGRLVDPLAFRLQQLELIGLTLPRIRSELLEPNARYYDVRILLLNAENEVVLDTDRSETMLGRAVDVTNQQPDLIGFAGGMQPFRAWHANWHGEDLYVFTSANDSASAQAPAPGQPPLTRLVVAVPADDVTAAWAALLPRQAVAGGLALLFAVVVGSFLAHRITRPIRQMTHASEAMTEGRYDQRIEVTGHDEVAQLGRAFNRMAGEVDRSQRATRQLLANVTHDLKTPLTSIQGFSQAMIDGLAGDPEEFRRLAQVIHDEAEHMNALVEDLLYLSRIESGELTLSVERLDLDRLVESTSRRFRYQADTNDVAVRLALGSGPIAADGRRLEQVLSNLLDNAIRFAPAGSEVLLRTHLDGAWAVIEVHNGGAPIPPASLPHVFDRFFQGDPARRRGHAGLGLAIVHELVQAHGGRVSVDSTADAGTTFAVRLRRDGPPAASPTLPPATEAAPPTEALARS